MTIAKALYQAPMGIGAIAPAEDIEIEIVPEGMDIVEEVESEPFDANLVDYISDSDLSSLATELIADFEDDVNARKDWLRTYIKGLKLLGLEIEERTEPWVGACGITHPLLMEAAVKFQSETIMETFPAMGPVKTEIIGRETPEKKDASIRVADDMNHELTDVMEEYRPEHERMLMALPLSGNTFKKIYKDPSIGRQTAVYVPVEDMIVPYGATNLQTADRVTHRMRKTQNELRKLQYSKFYRDDVDLGEPTVVMDEIERERAKEAGYTATADKRFQLLEMQVNLDLPGFKDVDEEKLEHTNVIIAHIVAFIRKNISEKLMLNTIAESAGLSTASLYRLFKRELGISPVEFIVLERIKFAKRLLKDKHIYVKNVSFEVGFDDCNYFIRAFKHHEGITPKQYQQLNDSDK